jgi:hypothetical protein
MTERRDVVDEHVKRNPAVRIRLRERAEQENDKCS